VAFTACDFEVCSCASVLETLLTAQTRVSVRVRIRVRIRIRLG